MMTLIALACVAGACALLVALSVVDLRVRLLPNEMVLGFAALGVIFHFATATHYLSVTEMITGAAIGFGGLYLVRALANRYYGADALGLGDVKLMGAAGLWLGPDGIALALMCGALAGLLHGGAVAARGAMRGDAVSLSRLQIPAGPGFAVGIALTAAWQFRAFFMEVWSVLT
jgi:leader peptidase (prepilin peptidase) / N-methyltransferase